MKKEDPNAEHKPNRRKVMKNGRKVVARGKPAGAFVAMRSYRNWILDLRKRYKATQCKAAIAVNSALLEFYWGLGRDISEKYAATQYYGSRFFECVSKDLTDSLGNARGLSVVNIRYSQRFYELYAGQQNLQQVVEELVRVPWGHHSRIIFAGIAPQGSLARLRGEFPVLCA